MTSQQFANEALARWQELRALPASERIEILMRDYFSPPPVSDFEYEIMLRNISYCMEQL